MRIPSALLHSEPPTTIVGWLRHVRLEGVWEGAGVIKLGHETQTLPHRRDRCPMGKDWSAHSTAQAWWSRAEDRYARIDQCLALPRARRRLLALAPARLSSLRHRLVVL